VTAVTPVTEPATSLRPPRAVTDPRLLADVDAAIVRARDALLALQRPDGSWNAREDMEPSATATQMVLDAFLGRLNARDAREGARFLATRQLADGSFPGWPHGTAGSVSVTPLVIAALHAAVGAGASGEARAPLDKANAWLASHGGTHGVVARMFSASDPTALWLSMVGLVDPDELPDPEVFFSLVPPLVKFMELRLNAGVIMGAMAMGWVTRLLRARKHKRRVDWLWLVHRAEAYACQKYMKVFQNPDGNFDGNTIQSALYVAGMYASGAKLARDDMMRATSWLDAQKRYDANGMSMCVFTCENWMTAFSLRALLHAGVSRASPAVDKACRFLVGSQITTDMPLVDQRRPNATRSGGWAFQPSNPTMPDSDDTGSVLSALGLAMNRDGAASGDVLSRETTELVQRSIEKAIPQLADMQAPGGGWSAFVWNLGDGPLGKAPGPLYTKPNALPRNLIEKAAFFLAPPVELKDPPGEGLTGRVLCGLGAVGYRAQAPEVMLAAQWLMSQRAANGVWWGRWLVNYLAGTSSVVSGLAACNFDMSEPWLSNAIDWMIARQNEDGGWGETPASYADPAQAGKGPSMPPLTGIVLTALIDAGRLSHPSVEAGVRYLLSTQQKSDNVWPNNAWLQVMMPPDQFYEYDGERHCRPLEALALFKKRVYERDHPPSPEARLQPLTPPGPFPVTSSRATGDWPRDKLQALRAFGDPVADAVITAVFKSGEAKALSDVMGKLVKSDEPLPAGLPPEAARYFTDTEAMPAWADVKQLGIAYDIFEQHGWAVALGLFTSSLPQAYCAGKGARVLLQTQGMTRHTRRRILETAQFVFDVLNRDAFGKAPRMLLTQAPNVEMQGNKGGRGIRAAQKVRLMHATIRHLTLIYGEWDAASWGLPINQEDLAGTLMTFSVVILDCFDTVGIALTPAQQAAYLHLWKVVGHFMGVHPDIVPRDVADGRALMNAIRADQWHASIQGAQLGAALVEAMDEYLPGDILKDLPSCLVRRVAGDRVADMLSLPAADWTSALLEGAGETDAFLAQFAHTKDAPGDRLLRYLITELMEALINIQREGKEAEFRIPTELIRVWTLND
jgi:squalene cyclase